LYSFCAQANCTDGGLPFAGLLADAIGNLFGTTNGGGVYGAGTVFELAKTAAGYASTPTTLYSFCAQANCTDGANPLGRLLADANGNLFGTTGNGGSNGNYGTVFEIVKTADGYASTPITLVSFNLTNGARLWAGLIADANGNLFGTTDGGGAYSEGAYGHGTVFEIPKTATGFAGTPTVLYSFCAQANCTDGEHPFNSLIADVNGNLFGTTVFGGAYGNGTVFEIPKTATGFAGTPTTLVSFCAQANCTDGGGPGGGLIADAIGNLFGTTEGGGAYGAGTVFELAKTAAGYASTPTTLYSFCAQANCTDGAIPFAGLLADANGDLFGTTRGGLPSYGFGTVFEITGSGFIPPEVLAGTSGQANCIGKTVSGLTQKYGSFLAAAAALGYSVQDLQNEVAIYCGG
jgi:uncharacterized repeat protein (TIGR03803 family)